MCIPHSNQKSLSANPILYEVSIIKITHKIENLIIL